MALLCAQGIASVRAVRRPRAAVALALAFLIGLTRIYLGVHWTTDVIGGWSLGAAWAMACWLVAYAIERLRGRPSSMSLQAGAQEPVAPVAPPG